MSYIDTDQSEAIELASAVAEIYQSLLDADREDMADKFAEIAWSRANDLLAKTSYLEKYEVDDFFPKRSGLVPIQTFKARKFEIISDIENEINQTAESEYYAYKQWEGTRYA